MFANWGSELDFFLNDLTLIKNKYKYMRRSYFFMTLLSLFCRVIGLKKIIGAKKIKKIFIYDTHNLDWESNIYLNRFISP